ncbi:hypothetical protein DH2020_006034 [Rehmannia glutinosa]|uniref:Uncharacterized protein n=1 Tax=Rehmannia glutinosa TaxID=99300 RepID=A0ABR0XHX1_REHGL
MASGPQSSSTAISRLQPTALSTFGVISSKPLFQPTPPGCSVFFSYVRPSSIVFQILNRVGGIGGGVASAPAASSSGGAAAEAPPAEESELRELLM